MELIYFWIDGYKNLNNFGVLLNPNFEVKYPDDTNAVTIHLFEKKNCAKIFGDNLNIMTLIGKNGSGKSNVINALSSVLRSVNGVYSVFKAGKYDDFTLPDDYCLVTRQEDKYIAYCSNPEKFSIELNTEDNEKLAARYSNRLNVNFKFEKRTAVQHGNKKINVAKFVPFFKEEETFYPEFTMENGTFDLIKIKLENYFYYDRFRIYDTVRNLIEFYKFNNDLGENEKLKFFEDNKDLLFNLYTPYLNLQDGLQWTNRRVQSIKEENYDITQVISRSFSTFSSYVKRRTYKKIDDILKTLLPKLFFAYALGEILDVMQKRNTKEETVNELKTLLYNLPEGKFPTSKERVDFYRNVQNIVNKKRINDMLAAYINYEGNDDEESDLKNVFREKYELVKNNDRNKSLILKLKNSEMITYDKIENPPSYITDIEALKGISKNLYKKEENEEKVEKDENVEKDEKEEKVYDFMSLSTGEQRISRFMADIYLALNSNTKADVFLFDEMDLSWHPEWQRKMVYYVKDIFDKVIKSYKDRKVNIIFATHSPIILSDMPRENVVFLNNSTKENDIQTFGANINDLFNNGLFFDCPDCLPMGEFAKTKIKEIFEILDNQKTEINSKRIEAQIALIGEPMLKNMLMDMLYKREEYPHEDPKLRSLQEENIELRKELEKYKAKYEKD